MSAQQSLIFDRQLIEKYNLSGPRYTSYPTAVQFNGAFTEADYVKACAQSNASERGLSLYFHIPYCNTACFYCACNKIPTRDYSRSAPYLQRLFLEIERQAALFAPGRVVEQVHLGGGTPTFLNDDQMRSLIDKSRQHFQWASDEVGEYSIEIDPRETDRASVARLRDMGFNRMSLGVQDFDPKVQKAVNRIQSKEQTFEVLHAAREFGFKSVNADLIYGLPYQTLDSFMTTLEALLEVEPDRFSIFNYAHLPEMFPAQKRMDMATMPGPDSKLQILKATIDHLTAKGYVFIGMDHFAKPDDELAVAQRQGKLHRNFQGYSTHADCDMIAMGASSISFVDYTYAQNVRGEGEYFDKIDGGGLAIFRGVAMTEDDIIRRAVINQLICHFDLNYLKMGQALNIDFQHYFAEEIADLQPFAEDGLIQINAEGFRVTPQGRLLIRNICMAFDAYLRQGQVQQRFSKVI